MKIKAQDKITFFPIKFVMEKNEDFFITCNEKTTLIDSESEHIIKLLQKYKTIEKISQNTSYYTKKEILERIDIFLSIDIIKQAGRVKFKYAKKINKYNFHFISKNLASKFFSLPAKTMLILVVTTSLLIISSDINKYFPKYEDFFFSSNYLLCIITSFIYCWMSIFRHEFFHFLAARSRNIPTTFSLSSRANFLVAQTEFENIYTIKEKNRFRLYLSGVFSDLLFFGIFIILLFLSNNNILNISKEFHLLIQTFALLELLGIIWQFLLFMKTDIYLFLSDLLDKETLMEDSKEYFKNIFKLKKQKANPLLFGFGIFVFIGIILITIRYITFDIPIKLKVIEDSFSYLAKSILSGSDVNIFLVMCYTFAIFIQLFEIGAIIYFTIKKRINKDLIE